MDFIIKENQANEEVRKYLRVYEIFNKRNKNEKKGQPLLDEMKQQTFSTDAECQIMLNTLYLL